MKETDDPRPVRELEPPPTTARPAEEDPTILAQWLYRALDQGPLFWAFLGGLAVIFVGLAVLTSSLMAAKSVTGQAWIDGVGAKTPEDQLKIADANPKTPIADYARLQAAYEEYRAGLDDLVAPGKRESAGPRLKKALTLFSDVARDAPKDSPQARGAAFAVARVHEARNELPEAIKQYRLVAETWKDSPEARQSETLARNLEDPVSVEFYKELYTARSTGSSFDPMKGLPDIPPPPPISSGDKPVDPLSPKSDATIKSILDGLSGPAGIDPPPLTPAPGATPAPATTPVPVPVTPTPVPPATPGSTPTAPVVTPEPKAEAPK